MAQRGSGDRRPEVGHSVHVEVAGLQPGREYWYRFRAGDEISQIGRTKTAPAAGSAVDRLRFAVCGCSHYETGYFTAYRRIAEEQFDFVFHTGDYIYEGRGHGGRSPDRGAAASGAGNLHGRGLSQPLRAVQVGSGPAGRPRLRAVHRLVGRSRGRQRLRGRSRRAGHAVGAVPAAPGGRVSGVLRDDAAAPPDGADRQHDAPVSAAPVRQPPRFERARHPPVPLEAGLRRRARSRPAPKRSIPAGRCSGPSRRNGCSRTWRARGHVDGAGAAGPDVRARRAEDRSGHAFPDGQMGRVCRRAQPAVCPAERDEGAKPGAPLRRRASALRRRFEARLHARRTPRPSASSSRTRRSPPAATASDTTPAWEQIKSDNPHIKYNSARRGYIACTATPATMRADFKVLDRVTVRDQPVRIGGSLVVEAGRRGASTP